MKKALYGPSFTSWTAKNLILTQRVVLLFEWGGGGGVAIVVSQLFVWGPKHDTVSPSWAQKQSIKKQFYLKSEQNKNEYAGRVNSMKLIADEPQQ